MQVRKAVDNMDPLSRIAIHHKEFTETENKIARAITIEPRDVVKDNITSVANKMKVSKSALLRFCQKIGYEGFSEFKYELTRFMNADENNDEKSNDLVEWIKNTLDDMNSKILLSSVQDVAEAIVSAKKIRIFGINETGLAAKQLYYRLLSLGIDSAAITELETMHFYSNLNFTNDLYIFFSLSATTEVIVDAMIKSSEKKKKTVLITQNTKFKYRDKISHTIVLPTINTEGKTRFVDSQMLNFVCIELLINNISKLLIRKEI
ncbi:MAG: MurR/RpiR family transcriptional regulator [Anaerorhabdus sp.]|uniref:MurR/RpiR family transcriptional regulator n=1 Tax=Anaerorhabdus sp. TaxID=1872524 RepID=UPI002FC9F948